MDAVWDFVRGLGAIVGLATGLFVVWDRFFRFAPSAIVIVRPLIPGGIPKAAYLRVTNRADRPILVSWQNGRRNGEFGIAADHSSRAIIVSILEGCRTIAIDPSEATELVLFDPPDIDEIDPENTIECELSWRYAQPKIWKRDRRISVRIPKRSLMQLDPDGYDTDPR